MNTFFGADIPQSQIETTTPKDTPEELIKSKADMRVMIDPAINAILPENREMVTQQPTNPSTTISLLMYPTFQSLKGREQKCSY